MSVEEIGMGFIRVANEAMCRPIRALTQVIYVHYSLDIYLVEAVSDLFMH